MLRLMLEEPPSLSGARYIIYKQSISDSGPASIHHLIKHTTVVISSTPTITAFQTGSVFPQVYTNRGHIIDGLVILPLSTAIPYISIHYA